MAGVDIFVIVEDVTTQLLTYESIEVHRSATVDGTYALVETETLVAGVFYYTINNSDGDLNKWYKYRFHHSTGPVDSDFSNPFRVDGVTRLRARQAALKEYGAGIILVSQSSLAAEFKTQDYRLANTLFRTDRGKGSWIHPSTGATAGVTRIVKSSVVSATSADFTVEPVWAIPLANGDEAEWHWLADPTVWNDANIRAMPRYWYVERVPITGVANQEEYDLSILPFLKDKEQIHDVRWYPTSGLDVDEPFGVGGRWWGVREDVGVLTLIIKPSIGATQTLYLETTRPMSPLYTDASAAPLIAAEELVAALTYDEVLAYLSQPGKGPAEENEVWRTARAFHAGELHRLLVKYRPKPRQAPAQLSSPPVVPQPWSAR